MELTVEAQPLGDLRPALPQNDTNSHLSCSFTSAINSKPCHTLGVTDEAQVLVNCSKRCTNLELVST